MRNIVLVFARVVALGLLYGCFMFAHGSREVVPRYGVFEHSFEHAGHYPNPYTEVTATATFTAPDGSEKTIPLFWDGDNRWQVRFSPNAVGEWNWTIDSNNSGLDRRQSGSFDCERSANKGGIRPSSDAPYHFAYENGESFWWFGDTQWSAFADRASEKLNRSSVLRYIDVRSRQGFNYIHSNLLHGTEEFPGTPTFTDIAEEALNLDFFQEVDYRLRYMNSKGIASGLFLAWSTDWNLFASDAARLRYARYVVARYSAYNVTFIVAGEWQKGGEDNEDRYVRIGNEIMNSDPHDRMVGVHPSARDRSYSASVKRFNTITGWMSFGDYQQNYSFLHAEILDSRDLGQPVVNAEYGYYLRDKDGDGKVDKPNSATRVAFRNASYDILMAGGYLVTGFATTYFGGHKDSGPFDVHAPQNDLAENDLLTMRELFGSTEWWSLKPADSLLTGPGTHYALAEPGEQYLAYVRDTSKPISLSLGETTRRTYEVRRFDPRTGIWTTLSNYTGVGPVALSPPDEQDWVFYLEPLDTRAHKPITADANRSR